MKTNDKELSVLEKYEVKTDWKCKSLWRRYNHRWLRYSGFIALAVIRRLKELGLSKKELAEKMNCSPQYISKLVRGQENLTLETIAKLEECLDIDLVSSALSYRYKIEEPQYNLVAEESEALAYGKQNKKD